MEEFSFPSDFKAVLLIDGLFELSLALLYYAASTVYHTRVEIDYATIPITIVIHAWGIVVTVPYSILKYIIKKNSATL